MWNNPAILLIPDLLLAMAMFFVVIHYLRRFET